MPKISSEFVGDKLYSVVVMPADNSLQRAVSFCMDIEYRITGKITRTQSSPTTLAEAANKTIYVYDLVDMTTKVYNKSGAGCILLTRGDNEQYNVITRYSDMEGGHKTLFKYNDKEVKHLESLR